MAIERQSTDTGKGTGETMRKVKATGILLLILLSIYIGSYVALSAGGCYKPFAIGLNGVKGYAWGPRGIVAYMKTGDLEKAIEDFTSAITLHPTFKQTYIARGQAFEMLGDLESAERDYELAKRL